MNTEQTEKSLARIAFEAFMGPRLQIDGSWEECVNQHQFQSSAQAVAAEVERRLRDDLPEWGLVPGGVTQTEDEGLCFSVGKLTTPLKWEPVSAVGLPVLMYYAVRRRIRHAAPVVVPPSGSPEDLRLPQGESPDQGVDVPPSQNKITDIKAGDRVTMGTGVRQCWGEAMEVTPTGSSVHVRWDNGHTSWVSGHDVKKVDGSPDPWHPKVGDVVKFKSDHPHAPKLSSPILELVGDTAKLNDGGWYGVSALELAPPTPRAEWKPKAVIGDRISSSDCYGHVEDISMECHTLGIRWDNGNKTYLGNDQFTVVQPAPWKLPEPPPNMQWHRTDFTAAMLPEGWRPLMKGEPVVGGDERETPARKGFYPVGEGCYPDQASRCFYRTRRPLPPSKTSDCEKLEAIKKILAL